MSMDTELAVEAGKRWEVFKAAAQQAQMKGNLVEAEAAWLSALEEAESLGEGQPQLVITLEGLAEVYWQSGKYGQAAPVCRRLLRIYETTLGPKHMDVAVIANNLAMLYHAWHKYDEAETFYKHALRIKHGLLPQDHPELLNLLASYARLLYETNRGAEAEELKAASQGFGAATWKRSGNWAAYEES
ncbi:MAG TPA: tetratricopeptide repeat protein [Candidatus Obscuribacterales bacterium]